MFTTEAMARMTQRERNVPLETEWAAYCERESWESESLLDVSNRLMVMAVYEETGWNQKKASEMLRISRRRMNYTLERWGLTKKEEKPRKLKKVT